jgi:hypothetical protein
MSGYKEQLDQLAASDRRQLILGIIVVAGILIAFVAMFFVQYFPGEIREVTDAIVSFKTEAGDDAVPPFTTFTFALMMVALSEQKLAAILPSKSADVRRSSRRRCRF